MPDKDGHKKVWTLPGAPWKQPKPEFHAGYKGKVYISGSMRGKPFFNFPTFDKVAAIYRAAGWIVFSPADQDRTLNYDVNDYPTGDGAALLRDHPELADMRTFARWDVDRIFESDLVVVLPDSEHSVGVTAEVALAKWLGIEVLVLNVID